MRQPSLPALLAGYDAQQAVLVGWLRALTPSHWAQASVLAGWTVHDLAFHTTEVPGSLTRAIAGGAVREKALSIGAYTAAWRAAATEIADRDRTGAAGLSPRDVLDRHDEEHAALHHALDGVTGDPVVRARRGPIRVSDFLLTRVNELVVHSRDLTASVPEVDPVQLDGSALGFAVRMLLGTLVERAPGNAVEVRVPPYAAVQAVAGPRHTRGTPGSVVETDPVTWVELATGRVGWHAALATGRLHASGEHADLSPCLPLLS